MKTVIQDSYTNSVTEFPVISGKRVVPVADLCNVAQKITSDGDDTYIGIADIGTAQATAAWMCYKISVSGSDITVTWADGNANKDNIATDLTALDYS